MSRPTWVDAVWQSRRSSILRCFHPEATATTSTTAALVMLLQPHRLSDESWEHFETTAATAASPTVVVHSRSSTCSSSPFASRAALQIQKALLKCAFETSSASRFPSAFARSVTCASARISEPSTGLSRRPVSTPATGFRRRARRARWRSVQ
eukprot:scaffold105688_cov60-Phaeocystis_antarctica.AAC.1